MAEQVPALHLNHQRRGADPRKGEELLRALRLEQRRVRRAIGEDQAVEAELSIVWLIAKVPAVRPERIALFVLFRQGLIDPVPDKSPCRRGWLRNACQYFANPPKLFPIAWAYSQRISGRVSSGMPIHFLIDHLGTAGKG